jgi:hypothetical protein
MASKQQQGEKFMAKLLQQPAVLAARAFGVQPINDAKPANLCFRSVRALARFVRCHFFIHPQTPGVNKLTSVDICHALRRLTDAERDDGCAEFSKLCKICHILEAAGVVCIENVVPQEVAKEGKHCHEKRVYSCALHAGEVLLISLKYMTT